MDYTSWRKELHSLQLRIDKLDDDYFEKEDFSLESKTAYETERKRMEAELNTMYLNTPEQ